MSGRRAEWAAGGVVLAAGIVARIVLLQSYLGFVNSDEATTGIEAKELLRGRVWVFVPANVYGGNAEAWIAAPFEALFDASPLRLKVLTSITWLLTAAVVYVVLRARIGVAGALTAAAVVWIPSAAIVQLSTMAYPGYGTGLLSAVLTMAVVLRLHDGPSVRLGFAAGALAGFAVWQHPLFLYVVAPFLALLAWEQRRAWRCVAAAVVGGLAALALPIAYNVRHDLPSIKRQPLVPIGYRERVENWFGDLIPKALGGKWQADDWILGRMGRPVVVLVLLALGGLAILALVRGPGFAKVAALAAVAAPVGIPIFSGAWYTTDARYAIVALGPVAFAAGYGVSLLPRVRVAPSAPLLVAGTVVVWSLVAVAVPFQERLGADADFSMDVLAAFLEDEGIDRVRADYWVAHQLSYETDEDIVAASIADIRFGHHDDLVKAAEADGRAALVLFKEQLPAFLSGAAPFDRVQSYRSAERVDLGRWIVFLPR
jgi:hypothetical protein